MNFELSKRGIRIWTYSYPSGAMTLYGIHYTKYGKRDWQKSIRDLTHSDAIELFKKLVNETINDYLRGEI